MTTEVIKIVLAEDNPNVITTTILLNWGVVAKFGIKLVNATTMFKVYDTEGQILFIDQDGYIELAYRYKPDKALQTE